MVNKKISASIVFAAVLCLQLTSFSDVSVATALPQRADPEKFRHAVNRSNDAGRIITMLAVMPDMTIPKELMDKAEAVAVFPRVVRETAFIMHASKGWGVVSARQEKGWTLPAFYRFAGGGYGSPFKESDTHGVILLFMTKDALSWFEKGQLELKNQKKAVEGPVGGISDVQRKQLEDAHVIGYAYYNGRLNGAAFGTSFWKEFGLNPDNNINNPVYGVKGREVLTGKQIDPSTVIPGIPAFQEALNNYYSR